MSTETIANRVSQLPIQASDGQVVTEIQTTELESLPEPIPVPRAQVVLNSQIDSTTVIPTPVITEEQKISGTHYKTASDAPVGYPAELIDDQTGTSVSVHDPEMTGTPVPDLKIDQALLITIAERINRDWASNREFQLKVISAFKNLGLDVRKHFGV